MEITDRLPAGSNPVRIAHTQTLNRTLEGCRRAAPAGTLTGAASRSTSATLALERTPQRLVCRLTLALRHDFPPDPPQVGLGRSIAAHIDPGPHAGQQPLRPGELDPRCHLLNRLKPPELDVDYLASGGAGKLASSRLHGIECSLQLGKPATLNPRAGAHCQRPRHPAIIAAPGARA